MGLTDLGERTDAHLLESSRRGDRRAFSELWRRHAPVAVAYARSLGAAPPDPEDVVSDAFLSILRLVRAGKGPDERFRPYLLTTVRNTWYAAARQDRALVELDEDLAPESALGRVDIEALADADAVTEAFHSLPERWQQALWLSEVEQLPPRAIAEVLGLRPNSVAALTYRARDALRKAWVRAHLRSAPAGTEHARVIELLGGYAYDDLSARSQRLVDGHLAGCRNCSSAAGEARHLAKAFTLGPLLAAGGGLAIAPAFFAAAPASAAWPVAASVAAAVTVLLGGGTLVAPPTQNEAGTVAIEEASADVAARGSVVPDPAGEPEPVVAPSVPAETSVPADRTVPADRDDADRPARSSDRRGPDRDRLPDQAHNPPGGGLGAPEAAPGRGGRSEEAIAHSASRGPGSRHGAKPHRDADSRADDRRRDRADSRGGNPPGHDRGGHPKKR